MTDSPIFGETKMPETFYRKPDGAIVFHACGQSDSERSTFFAEAKRKYDRGSFSPKSSPVVLGEDIIWEAYRHSSS